MESDALFGTSSFNTACLVLLSIERGLFYLLQLIRLLLGKGDTKIVCESCCGCFAAELDQSESERSITESEASEISRKVNFLPDESESMDVDDKKEEPEMK